MDVDSPPRVLSRRENFRKLLYQARQQLPWLSLLEAEWHFTSWLTSVIFSPDTCRWLVESCLQGLCSLSQGTASPLVCLLRLAEHQDCVEWGDNKVTLPQGEQPTPEEFISLSPRKKQGVRERMKLSLHSTLAVTGMFNMWPNVNI